MKMKKILAIFLAAIMLFSLAACDLGSTEDPNKDNPGASQTEDQGGEGTSGTDDPWIFRLQAIIREKPNTGFVKY